MRQVEVDNEDNGSIIEAFIVGRLIPMIHRETGIPIDQMHPDSHLYDDLGAESLDVMEIVLAAGREYGRSIKDMAFCNAITIRDLALLCLNSPAAPKRGDPEWQQQSLLRRLVSTLLGLHPKPHSP